MAKPAEGKSLTSVVDTNGNLWPADPHKRRLADTQFPAHRAFLLLHHKACGQTRMEAAVGLRAGHAIAAVAIVLDRISRKALV